MTDSEAINSRMAQWGSTFWTRFRTRSGGGQFLGWLFLWWLLIPALVFRTGWSLKTKVSVLGIAALAGIGTGLVNGLMSEPADSRPPITSAQVNDVAENDSDSLPLPDFEIVERKDVSYDFGGRDAAQRLTLWVEIPQSPVTKEQLESLAAHLIENERGRGWHAVSIAMGADRRETKPAYAMFEWAPGGDWEKASQGDPETWAGYEFSIDWAEKMSKLEEPACAKPPPIAFQYNDELWDAPASMSEKRIIANIAARHDDKPARVKRLLEDVLEWEFC